MHSPISSYQLQSTPDNSNLQGNSFELSGVRVIEGKIIENDLKGNENWFELARVRVSEGSSYRESTVKCLHFATQTLFTLNVFGTGSV